MKIRRPVATGDTVTKNILLTLDICSYAHVQSAGIELNFIVGL